MAPKRGNSGSPGKRLSKEFIDDSDADEGSEDGDYGATSKAKKVKADKKPTAPKKAKKEEVVDDEVQDDNEAGAQGGSESSAGVKKNDDGDSYVSLSKDRRVTVRKFKSAVLVDVREMYEKDGKVMPGKKGISLTVPQWELLKASFGAIDGALEALQ